MENDHGMCNDPQTPTLRNCQMFLFYVCYRLIIPSFLQREKLLGMAELLFPSPGEDKVDSKVEAEEEEDLEETRWSSRRSKESESEDSGESEESGIGETGSDGSSLGR